MTIEEAQKVANIIAQADSGCPYCVGWLLREARKIFPEFVWSDYDDFADTGKQIVVTARKPAND